MSDDILLIKVVDFLCVIPLWNVLECVPINKAEYQLIDHQGYFNLREQIIPVISLNNFWGIKSFHKQQNTLVVIQYTEHKIGIIVDDLQGEVQTIIKPMPEILSGLSWINGTAVLGTGEVAVILDIPGLVADVIEKYKHLSKIGATI